MMAESSHENSLEACIVLQLSGGESVDEEAYLKVVIVEPKVLFTEMYKSAF